MSGVKVLVPLLVLLNSPLVEASLGRCGKVMFTTPVRRAAQFYLNQPHPVLSAFQAGDVVSAMIIEKLQHSIKYPSSDRKLRVELEAIRRQIGVSKVFFQKRANAVVEAFLLREIAKIQGIDPLHRPDLRLRVVRANWNTIKEVLRTGVIWGGAAFSTVGNTLVFFLENPQAGNTLIAAVVSGFTAVGTLVYSGLSVEKAELGPILRLLKEKEHPEWSRDPNIVPLVEYLAIHHPEGGVRKLADEPLR